MALSIRDPDTDRLARELAAFTGESMTAAIREAIAERLARLRGEAATEREKLVQDGLAIARRCAQAPIYDERSLEEILGYDENGLPG